MALAEYGWLNRIPAEGIRRAPPPRDVTETSAPLEMPRPSAVRNQGEIPCCVSCAIIGAMEIMGRIAFEHGDGNAPFPLSQVFHYQKVRGSNGIGNMTIEGGMSVATEGVIELTPPPEAAERITPDHLRRDWGDRHTSRCARTVRRGRRLPPCKDITISARGWTRWIQDGRPIIVGLRVPPFEEYSAQLTNDPRHQLDCSQRNRPDHHCVLAVGASDNAIRILDSFGTHHGDSGYWWLPAEGVRRPIVARAWVIREVQFD